MFSRLPNAAVDHHYPTFCESDLRPTVHPYGGCVDSRTFNRTTGRAQAVRVSLRRRGDASPGPLSAHERRYAPQTPRFSPADDTSHPLRGSDSRRRAATTSPADHLWARPPTGGRSTLTGTVALRHRPTATQEDLRSELAGGLASRRKASALARSDGVVSSFRAPKQEDLLPRLPLTAQCNSATGGGPVRQRHVGSPQGDADRRRRWCSRGTSACSWDVEVLHKASPS
jgi:hypothetical protein